MALKTTGSLEGDSFKATTPSASTPGFVTNDPTGLLEYGQGGASTPTPVGASVWDFIEHTVLPSETECLTFSGLSGTADKVYKLIFRNLAIPNVLELIDSSNYGAGEDLVAGEIVTGGTSGATATVDSFVAASVGSPGSVLTTVSPSGTFLDGEVVTGTSGFSVTIATGGQSSPLVRYTIRPNGLSTDQKTTSRHDSIVPVAVHFTSPDMTFLSERFSMTSGIIYLFARPGKARIFYSDSNWSPLDVATNLGLFSSFGHWTDTVTEITSLDICSSLANGGLPAGALFTLYKINN